MSSEKITTLTSATFAEFTNNPSVPVLIDFWAQWCGPCKALGPVLDQIAEELGDTVKIGKFDIDTDIPFAKANGIQSIPALYIYKKGERVETSIGLTSKENIIALIKKYQ